MNKKFIYFFSLITLPFLLLLSGCSGNHSGVSLQRADSPPKHLGENDGLFPTGLTDFTLKPGDVLRLNAVPVKIEGSNFLIENGNQIRLSFHFDAGHYYLMPGDYLRVNFATGQNLDFETTIRLDGILTIPRAGEIVAAGRTPEQLALDITKQLKERYKDSRASVTILRTNTSTLDTITGSYRVLPDGRILLPILGPFNASGITPEHLASNISSILRKKLKNNFKATIVIDNALDQQLESYNQVVNVSPSGDLILPQTGTVHIDGLTMTQAKEKIQKSIQSKYKNPIDISITLISGVSNSIYVSGEVRFPGVYPLAAKMTMLKAITIAGGVTPAGDISEALLVHYEENGSISVYKSNLEDVIELASKNRDLLLSPQDIILVPRTDIADANLWVQQYIINMLPFNRSVNYNYNQNPDLNN